MVNKKKEKKMAIHTKVGILTHVPGSSASVTPGLIDGLYADFLTKSLDFMDDSRMYPKYEWFTASSRAYIGIGDWEDLAGTYRQWRDEYTKAENEYWITRSVRAPFQYKNFVKDPAPYSNDWNGSNPVEWIRMVYPAPNGDFNMPYPNPTGSDHYMYHNSSMPLLHNRTKFRIPIVEAALSYSVNEIGSIENQSYVRDNQASIDVVQAELDTLIVSVQQTTTAYYAKNDELQNLINSGADQTLIDAAQAELDVLNVNNNLLNDQQNSKQAEINSLNEISNWVEPDTMETRFIRYRQGRDRWLYLIGQMIQRDLTPEETTEMESLESNERVLSGTGDFYVSMWSDERFAPYYDRNGGTNHPLGTMPADVLPGITDINILPAVQNSSLLPSVGNPGDVIRVIDEDDYAWDPQNQEWSLGFFNRFLSDLTTTGRAKRDAHAKAKNELALAMRPVEFAGFYIPGFAITVDGAYETLQA